MKGILTTALFLFFALQTVCAQDVPFVSGEKFSFKIEYRWGFSPDIADVNVSLTEIPEEGCLHSVVNVATRPFFDNFFKMRDLYECKFIPNSSVQPVWYHRDIVESKYWSKNFCTWSEDASSVHIIVDKSTRPHKDTVYRESEVIHDIVNMLYVARSVEFGENNPEIRRLLMVDRDIFEVRVRYLGKEEKKVSREMGSFNCVKLGISMRTKVQFGDGKVYGMRLGEDVDTGESTFGRERIFLWLSDDENKAPVYFSAPMKIGSINGVLTSFEGLAHELSSKVEEFPRR